MTKGKGTKTKLFPGSTATGDSPAKKKVFLMDEADMECDREDGGDAAASASASGVSAETTAGDAGAGAAAAQPLAGDGDRPPAWFKAFEARQEARFETLLRECRECREEHAGLKLDFDNLKDTVKKTAHARRRATWCLVFSCWNVPYFVLFTVFS